MDGDDVHDEDLGLRCAEGTAAAGGGCGGTETDIAPAFVAAWRYCYLVDGADNDDDLRLAGSRIDHRTPQ